MKRPSLYFPYVMLAGIVGAVGLTNVRRDAAAMSLAGSNERCPPCGMLVSPDTLITADRDGRHYRFCSNGCRTRFLAQRSPASASTAEPDSRCVDVVCHMEVNVRWGIRSEYAGRVYHFCNENCKSRFDADPSSFLEERCLVCRGTLNGQHDFPATYVGRTYHLCSAEHRAEFKRDPAAFFMHSMWGIPSGLYYSSIALVLLVSFGLFEWVGGGKVTRETIDPAQTKDHREFQWPGAGVTQHHGAAGIGGGKPWLFAGAGGAPVAVVSLPVLARGSVVPRVVSPVRAEALDRFDLLRLPWFSAAVRSRVFRFGLRLGFVLIFLLIIAAGLFGDQNPSLNLAPILTWTVWWGALILLILFAGKAWCYVCPWDAIAEWSEKLAFWKKTDDGLSARWKWPRAVRNILIATVLFVGLTWVELGFGVTMRPRVTAHLAIAMLLMAIVSAMLFDRKSFCRYGCLVGRVSGLYALFSSVEVRARSASACARCRGKECVTGSEQAYGCPTFLFPGKLTTNTYCIQCMECVQACPEDNLAVNLRPWGTDLVAEGKPRADEAYLALLMLAITGFHGLTMTPVWQRWIDLIRGATGSGRMIGFSLGMTMLMLGPIAVYAGLVWISMRLGEGVSPRPLAYKEYFVRYAYALLPIALFYHIAHNMEHLLMEGPKVLAMASDPFGWGWNVLGTAGWVMPPLVSLDRLWLIQVFLVLVGHVYSLWVAQRTSLRLFGSSRAAFRSQLPMLAAMIAFSVFSLWLLKQPMEMRTSAM